MSRYELGYSHGYDNAAADEGYEGHERHDPEHPDDPEYMQGYAAGELQAYEDS